MDFGIGFLSNKVMLPILDFSGIVPIWTCDRSVDTGGPLCALSPECWLDSQYASHASYSTVDAKAGQRNSERNKDNPAKLQEEMSCLQRIWQSAGWVFQCWCKCRTLPCLPLRGSPFSDVNYTVNLQIFPLHKLNKFNPSSATLQNIYISDGVHVPLTAIVPGGNRLTVGEKQNRISNRRGSLQALVAEHPETTLFRWKITKVKSGCNLMQTAT